MDFGGMRQWLKRNGQDYMVIVERYPAIINEKEMPAVEYRLLLLRGDMDYTTYALEPEVSYDADETAAKARLFDRLCWETQRDTRVALDTELAMENGRRYREEG